MEEFFCSDCIVAMPAAKFYVSAGIAFATTLVLLVLAHRAFHRARLIEDMPTSKIRSASQGYVELSGLAEADDETLQAPLTASPCLWWRFKIEKYKRSGRSSSWVTVEKGMSDKPFPMRDSTGKCLVDPAGAEIACLHKKVWYGSTARPSSAMPSSSGGFSIGGLGLTLGRRYRYTEYLIRDGDPLYVLGYFRTDAGGQRTMTVDRLAGQIIRQWKQDYPSLLSAFDTNNDQQLDLEEWRAVEAAARQQAVQQQVGSPDEKPLHRVSRPKSGGLPFLIGSQGEEQMSRRFRFKAFFAAVGFLVSGSLTTWLVTSRFF